jgi:hypothetical protein
MYTTRFSGEPLLPDIENLRAFLQEYSIDFATTLSVFSRIEVFRLLESVAPWTFLDQPKPFEREMGFMVEQTPAFTRANGLLHKALLEESTSRRFRLLLEAQELLRQELKSTPNQFEHALAEAALGLSRLVAGNPVEGDVALRAAVESALDVLKAEYAVRGLRGYEETLRTWCQNSEERSGRINSYAGSDDLFRYHLMSVVRHRARTLQRVGIRILQCADFIMNVEDLRETRISQERGRQADVKEVDSRARTRNGLTRQCGEWTSIEAIWELSERYLHVTRIVR